MSKTIIFDTEAKKKLEEGAHDLAKAVASTLGASGKCVAIQNGDVMAPHITKDGVTVAKAISFKDPIKNMGASLVKEAASKTADEAGDGTTTSTVLADSFISLGLKQVMAGANPIEMKKGIDRAVKKAIEIMKNHSQEVGDDYDKIKNVATISANNDEEIGVLIADALQTVKKDGILTVEESKGTETYVDKVEGMQFDKGFISPYFCNKENKDKQECVLENPYILFYDKPISQFASLMPVLNSLKGSSLLIIAENVDNEALTGLVINKLKGVLNVCAVKAPSYGDAKKDILQDLAILTGGEVVTRDKGMELEHFQAEYFGTAEKVIVTKDNTTIINGNGDKDILNDRINFIKNQIENVSNDYDKEKLQERLAKLAGGVAVLYVGANSEVEMKEKKDRVDDALCSTKAAVQEGIIPGGSVAYIRASLELDEVPYDNEDQKIGIEIVKQTLQTPIKIIARNVGKTNGEVVLNEIITTGNKEDWYDYGYNAKTDTYEGMIKAGIIDPTKVARVALENAASIASMFLITDCVVCEEEKETPSQTMPQMM